MRKGPEINNLHKKKHGKVSFERTIYIIPNTRKLFLKSEKAAKGSNCDQCQETELIVGREGLFSYYFIPLCII